jgi:hypothetical protein
MWIWRSEYDNLKRKIYELENHRDILQSRVGDLEVGNLKLQDVVQSMHIAQSVKSQEDDPFGGDPLAEDNAEVQRLIQEIKRDGRDVVISREVRNG